MIYATFDVLYKYVRMILSSWLVLLLCCLNTSLTMAALPNDTLCCLPESTQGNDRIVSLLIADQGDVLYSALGHAAIRVVDSTDGTDCVYTYEGEPVRNQLFRFLSGRLRMGMFCVPTSVACAMYESEGRGVCTYRMNLSAESTDRLIALLDARVGEGINLPYDYYHRGCAQTIVEMVTQSVDSIVYAPWPDKFVRQTQRELCYQGGNGRPWAQFWTFTLIGHGPDDVGVPCEEKLLVPRDLLEVWQKATVDGLPLVSDEPEVLVNAACHADLGVVTPMLIACLLFSMLVLRTDYLMLIVVSLFGILETYLVLFSSLPCSDWHWLLIPFNVLPLLLWPWRRYWALPWAVVLIIWWIGILVWPHQLVTPAHLVLVAAEVVWLLGINIKQRKN